MQNLKELRELSVSGTGVSDLTPLGECDFSAACGEEGFELGLGDTPVEDFSPLAAIRVYRGLDLNGHDPSLWMDAAADSDIRGLQCGFSTCTDGQLAEIAGQHPELEELSISQCENVTDLTPLLKLENLRRVRVSGSMEQALASLEGQEYGFELEIE